MPSPEPPSLAKKVSLSCPGGLGEGSMSPARARDQMGGGRACTHTHTHTRCGLPARVPSPASSSEGDLVSRSGA
jgi:hypothetical protein